MKSVFKFIIAILIPLAVGGVSSFFTLSSVNGWFTTLNKPSFNPPNWLFAPVWTLLYLMMGSAFFLIWKNNTGADIKRKAIILFFTQLTLNFFWSFIFFYAHQIGWALIDIILMWVFIVYTIFTFGKISSSAAWLLVPYICWVSFASLLNFAIWKLN